MKRISLLVVLMVLWANVAFAANWVWMTSDDEIGWFFDSESIKYGKIYDTTKREYIINRLLVDVWIKKVYTQKGADRMASELDDWKYSSMESELTHVRFFTNKTLMIIEYTDYDYDGRVINSSKVPSPKQNTIYPESIGEFVYNSIMDYCRQNNRYVTMNTYAK